MPIARLKQAISARLGERGGILHSIGTLVGGTAFAQALTVLALPLLTRLYTPAEFSVLAVYASVLGILSVVACLRLEIAIPLPESDEGAANLLAIALASGLVVSALAGATILLFGAQLSIWIGVPAFAPYLWMVPVGMAMASAYAAMQFWSTRKKRFTRIARTRVVQALGGVGVQVGAGAAGIGPIGLVLGQLISGGAGFIGLARDAWQQDRNVFRAVNPAAMRRLLGQYSRFPKYSTLEALANTAGIQVPVIIIAALAAGPEAGFLLLATRIVAAPMSLVGGSIAQVYLAHAPEELRAGRLGEFTARILGGLMKTGVGPLMFVGIVAGPLSGIVFGKEWTRVGELVAWMTPWFILQFLSSPVSMVMHVLQRHRVMMVMQIVGLVIRTGALWATYIFNPTCLAESYALSGMVFYGVCCLAYYRIAGVCAAIVFPAIWGALFNIVCWVVAGMFLQMTITILLKGSSIMGSN